MTLYLCCTARKLERSLDRGELRASKRARFVLYYSRTEAVAVLPDDGVVLAVAAASACVDGVRLVPSKGGIVLAKRIPLQYVAYSMPPSAPKRARTSRALLRARELLKPAA